jgi:hypothetical protein
LYRAEQDPWAHVKGLQDTQEIPSMGMGLQTPTCIPIFPPHGKRMTIVYCSAAKSP